MKVRTNNHWREFHSRSDVPDNVLSDQFDWTEEAYIEHGDYSDGFIKHRGCWYHLSQFMRTPCELESEGWEGIRSTSFSTAVVLRLSSCGDMYQIGTLAV